MILFKLITGALVATIGAAIYVFIGKDPNELIELTTQKRFLRKQSRAVSDGKRQVRGTTYQSTG